MKMSFASTPRPGESVRRTSWRLYEGAAWRGLGALFLIVFAIAVAAQGSPAVGLWIAVGGGVLALRAWRRQADAGRYRLGALAEERVGALLEPLCGEGWLVEHDVAKRGGGNVDHVVHSPSVTFTIDTKRSRWRGPDLSQAHRHAEWAAGHYGNRRLIVPVICVERSKREVEVADGVYIVGASRLIEFLCARG
jgi:Nuclease-related domain